MVVAACSGSDNPPSTSPGGTAQPETNDALCGNGLDDDRDGYIDCQDPDCTQTVAVLVCRSGENTLTLCHDSQDNDNDGATDCDDSIASFWIALRIPTPPARMAKTTTKTAIPTVMILPVCMAVASRSAAPARNRKRNVRMA